jgi:hypothetical protein
MLKVGISGGPSPFSMMIMQSQQDADLVIKELEAAVQAGYNPNMVFSQVLDRCNIKEKNLTDFDRQRIKRKVEQLSKYQSLKGRS